MLGKRYLTNEQNYALTIIDPPILQNQIAHFGQKVDFWGILVSILNVNHTLNM